MIENRCEDERNGMKRLLAKRKMTLIDIVIKRWAFSFKWERFFQWNERDFFIEMRKENFFIEIKRDFFIEMRNLFHWNEKIYFIEMKRIYFIQMRRFNDHIQIILLSKLFSFVKKCMIDRLNIIVQKDKILSHAFKHQDLVFMNVDVQRFLWSSSSFDLNMIESCWF